MQVLATQDPRTPLCVTLASAKQQADPNLALWEEEFAQLLTEIARKFYGSLTALSVQSGCRTADHLLSLALLHTSEGRHDPESWLTQLRTLRLHGLSALIIDRFKACHALPAAPLSAPGKRSDQTAILPKESVKELLLHSMEICQKKGVLAAYLHLQQLTQTRQAYADEAAFLRWLVDSTPVGKSVLAAYRPSSDYLEALCEELIRDILYRLLPLPEGLLPPLSFAADSAFSEDHPPMPNEPLPSGQKISLSPAAHQQAHRSYFAFVARVPDIYHKFLQIEEQSWFAYHFILEIPTKRRKTPAKSKLRHKPIGGDGLSVP
jgi:hypothetical protein